MEEQRPEHRSSSSSREKGHPWLVPPCTHWLCHGAGPHRPAGTLQPLWCFLPFISVSSPLRPGPNPSPGGSAWLDNAQTLRWPHPLPSSSLPNSQARGSETRLNFFLLLSLEVHFRQTDFTRRCQLASA